jgi:hypothetical protein
VTDEQGGTQVLADVPRKKDDEVVPAQEFEGRAVSRSDDTLHLAIRTGVVNIPLSSVESVTPISATDDELVRVTVSQGAPRVKHAFRVADRPTETGPGPEIGIGEKRMDAARAYADTATLSGGVPDACDDVSGPIVIIIIVVACW